MPRGVAVARRVDDVGELGRADAGPHGEHAEHGGLGADRVVRRHQHLGAVARRDHDGLVDRRRGDRLAREALGLRLAHGHALAQGDRRGLVGDAEAQQFTHTETSSPRTKFT